MTNDRSNTARVLLPNYSKKEELVMHFMTLQVLHFLCALHNLDI